MTEEKISSFKGLLANEIKFYIKRLGQLGIDSLSCEG